MSPDSNYIQNLEEQVKRLKLVQYVSTAMNSAQDDKELLTLMLDQSIKLTGATSGSIMKKTDDSPFLQWEIARGIDDSIMQKTPIRIGEGVTGVVVQEGVAKLVNDVSLEPKYISVKDDVRSELAVPLISDGRVIGVISVDSQDKNSFSEYDLELLQTIAHQAAQILTRNTLYDNLNRKIKLKDILIHISNEIENLFELNDIFDITMKQLADGFSISRGMLVLFENDTLDSLSVFSAYNLTEEEISRGNYKVGEGIIGKVVESGKPISIPNINSDPQFLNRMQVKRNKDIPVSFTAIPIKIDGLVSGVLAIEKNFKNKDMLHDEQDMLYLIGNLLSNKVKNYQRVHQERVALLEENIKLKQELYDKYTIDNFIGKNAKMLEVFELIKLVADSNSSIMILGESGTGKELVAKSLHMQSSRRENPFISINCAAIPENLLESELFGHTKGAFTGANTDKKGKFQQANGGTLFLDEIGDMPLYLQAKLLRAIQDKEIEPLGSESKIKLDIRLISATNKNLSKYIKENLFREDLYYRLNVVEIKIPPLRERKDDIPLLAEFFIRKYAKFNNRKTEKLSFEALRLLQAYDWKGNVRELENVIERAVLLSQGKTLEVNALPDFIQDSGGGYVSDISIGKWLDSFIKNPSFTGKVYETIVSYIEKELITKALIFNKRNKVKTSDFLGINRNTLRFKMNDYDINI